MEQGLVRVGEEEDLRKILEEKRKAALKNLVTGVTPRDVILQRPARGGLQVDYIPVWWFIDQANALFGHLWDFEVLDHNIGSKQVWVKGKVTVKIPGRTEVVTVDGRTTEVRYDPIEVSKTQFGGADLKTYKERPGEIIDIGDDLKSASSDALKKCLTGFGFAADVYGHREVLEQTGPKRSQLEALYSVGSKVGMSRDQVDTYCTTKYSKLPEELEVVLLLGLIQELRKTVGANT